MKSRARPIPVCSGTNLVSDLFEHPENATPLTPEEKHQLIPAHIAYRSELNEAEQENITRGQDWALARRRDLSSSRICTSICSETFGAGPES